MDESNEEVYRKARPIIRGVIALLFAVRLGPNRSQPVGSGFEYFFVLADDFLTTFEQRRS